MNNRICKSLYRLFLLFLHLSLQKIRCLFSFLFFFTCVYFASGSKCGLATPLTSGELAGGKLVLLIALHSSSLALEKDGLSLTGGAKEKEKRGKSERSF